MSAQEEKGPESISKLSATFTVHENFWQVLYGPPYNIPWVNCNCCGKGFEGQVIVEIETECEGLAGAAYLCKDCITFIYNQLTLSPPPEPDHQPEKR